MPNFWLLPRSSATDDSTPNAFAWDNNITGATPNALYASSVETITGINIPAPVTVTGGMWRKNGGAYTADPGYAGLNDTVQVQGQASPLNNTPIDVVLTVGGVSATFRITTVAASSTFYSILGPYVSWTEEAAMGSAFTTMQNRILTLRKDNRLWGETSANYGYCDVLWMALQRGGIVSTDWENDAVAFLNSWLTEYPNGEAGEQHRLNIGPLIAHIAGKANAVQAKAMLDRSGSTSATGDNLLSWIQGAQPPAFTVTNGYYGGRIHHKVWEQLIVLKLIGNTSRDWVAYANLGKAGFLNGLDTEGNLPAYGVDGQGGPSKHWQNALVCRSAIFHYNHIAADPAIINAVERAAESPWRQRNRVGPADRLGCLPYMNRYKTDDIWRDGNNDSGLGSNDLIMHWMDVYGWLAWIRGDTTWITRADLFHANANQSFVNNTYTAGIKNYDEDFAMFTWRYSYWKTNAVMTTGRPVCTVVPTLTGTMAQGQTITANPGTYPNGVTSRLWRFYRLRNTGATNGGYLPATGYQAGNTYVLTAADVGCYMFACEAPTNAAGRGAESLTAMSAVVT